MYLLISLCYFTAKGQLAGTQHYINGLNRSRYDIKQAQQVYTNTGGKQQQNFFSEEYIIRTKIRNDVHAE